MSRNAKNQKPRTKQIQKQETNITRYLMLNREFTQRTWRALRSSQQEGTKLPVMVRIEEPAKGLQRGANIRNVKNDRSCN